MWEDFPATFDDTKGIHRVDIVDKLVNYNWLVVQ